MPDMSRIAVDIAEQMDKDFETGKIKVDLYLFAIKWRSSIRVQSLRIFTSEEELYKHARKLLRKESDPILQANFYFAYQLFKSKEPILLRDFGRNLQEELIKHE